MATLPGGGHVDGSGLSDVDRDILTRAFADLGFGDSNLVHVAAGASIPAAVSGLLNVVELTSEGGQSSFTLPDGYQALVAGNTDGLTISGNDAGNLIAGS